MVADSKDARESRPVVPITILPIPTFVGPGTSLFVSTDFIGPIPNDASWIAQVYSPHDAENPAAYWTLLTNGLRTGVMENYQGQFSAQNGANVQTGEACTLRIVLQESNGQEIDESDRLPVTWDGSGQLARWIQHQPQAEGSGLTAEEHTWLDTTQQAVQQGLQTATGAILSTPIGSIIAHPDVRFLNFHTPCTTLTGRGRLSPPGPVGFGNVYGIVTSFEVVPEGFGLRDGLVQEYLTRVVQLVAFTKTNDATTEYITEVHDVNADGEVWLWSLYDPSSVGYDVTPGCRVSVCFLTVAG
jgi:hypothetical protein